MITITQNYPQHKRTLFSTWGPFYLHGLTLIPSNNIHYKVWDMITHPFQNFSGTTVEVSEWISAYIPHSIGHVIIFPSWYLS